MPLTNTQALLLSNDALLAGLVENDPKRIQLSRRLPFYALAGDRLTVPRVTNANLGTALWDAGGTALSDTPAVPNDPNVSFSLKLLATSFKVNYTAEYDMSNVNDQVEVQTVAAVKRLYYKFWETFNTGDNSVNVQEFDGLRRLVVSGQTLTARDGAGGIPALRELDQLIGKITTNGGRPHVFYTSRKGAEAIRRAYYREQVTPETVLMQVEDADGASRTVSALAFDGIPVVVDDQVPNNETSNSYTSIYALVLGREGIYGVIPRGSEGRMIQAARVLIDGKGQDGWIAYWPVGVALESQAGVARLQQVG
ncbi:MAG: phage major capsid protein [Planctomycetes bacterium]|nr:phage major capsid protein [Planctomycetota bacterium]